MPVESRAAEYDLVLGCPISVVIKTPTFLWKTDTEKLGAVKCDPLRWRNANARVKALQALAQGLEEEHLGFPSSVSPGTSDTKNNSQHGKYTPVHSENRTAIVACNLLPVAAPTHTCLFAGTSCMAGVEFQGSF